MLRQLAQFHAKDPNNLFMVRIAQGLTHLGKGTLTLCPYHSDRQLLSPVALAGLLSTLIGFLDVKNGKYVVHRDRSGNHGATMLGSTVLEDGVGVSSMNVRKTILLSNKICLEYGSNKTVLSFVRNLYAVEPITLWPAAILRSSAPVSLCLRSSESCTHPHIQDVPGGMCQTSGE
jgi:hypothetical protein